MAFKIAGLGEVLWDVFPEGEKFGGAPANFACHCRSLGAEVSIVSCVGKDRRGEQARAFLTRHGVDTSCLAASDGRETGIVLVHLDSSGKPDYEIKENVAWDFIPWTGEMASAAPRMDAVCFGSLCQRSRVSRDSVRRFLETTRPDCLRVFDINIRQSFHTPAIIDASLRASNVLKLNDEELPVVASTSGVSGTREQQLEALIAKYDLELAILTCGAEGALMMTAEETSFAAPRECPVVSTVGAGDAFTAATIMGFLSGKRLDAVNEHANEVAAYVCTQQGAVPALPGPLTA